MQSVSDISSGVARGASNKALTGGQIVDAVTSGVPVKTILNATTDITLTFPKWGDVAYRIIPAAPISITLAGGEIGQYQEMVVLIQQPLTGNSVVSLPDNITWCGPAPFVDSRIGGVTMFRVWTFDAGETLYGKDMT